MGDEYVDYDDKRPLVMNSGGNIQTDRFENKGSAVQSESSTMSYFYQWGLAIEGYAATLFCIPFAICGSGPVIQVEEGNRAAILEYGQLKAIVPPGTYHRNIGSEEFIIMSIQIQTLTIPSQQVMTKDNISVVLDAVCFYRCDNVEKAIFNVDDCDEATKNLAQSTLETILGEKTLDELLTKRQEITERVAELIDQQSESWGIHIQALEIRDIRIPDSMQRVMAAVAEANREGEAKVVMAKAEFKAASTYSKAAKIMARNPVSMQLRYFQTLTEIASEKKKLNNCGTQ